MSWSISARRAVAGRLRVGAALSRTKAVIVERQVEGVCHRLFMAHGRLLYAVKRLPMSVEGDGVTDIAGLSKPSWPGNCGCRPGTARASRPWTTWRGPRSRGPATPRPRCRPRARWCRCAGSSRPRRAASTRRSRSASTRRTSRRAGRERAVRARHRRRRHHQRRHRPAVARERGHRQRGQFRAAAGRRRDLAPPHPGLPGRIHRGHGDDPRGGLRRRRRRAGGRRAALAGDGGIGPGCLLERCAPDPVADRGEWPMPLSACTGAPAPSCCPAASRRWCWWCRPTRSWARACRWRPSTR